MSQVVQAGIRPESSSPVIPEATAQGKPERSAGTKGRKRTRKKSTITEEEAAKIKERERKEDIEERKEFLTGIFETVLSSVIFFVVTTVFYSHRMGWTTTEAMYFSMVTMSTVGYGDYSPDDNFWNRFFTVGTIFIGVVAIFSSIASTFAALLQPFLTRSRQIMENWFPQKGVDIDGDGTMDFKMPRSPPVYYSKNMLPGIVLVAFCQIISSLIFMSIEEWDFGTAMYHCIVTATTVGYGDVKIAKQGGMRFAFFHILLSVCLLGALISDFGELRDERKKLLDKVSQLQRKLDPDLMEQLMLRAKEMRPEKNHDDGISELEFVLAMIIELEMVDEEDVKPFIGQFRALDKDGNDTLSADDLKAIAEQYKKNTAEAQEAMDRKPTRGPAGVITSVGKQALSKPSLPPQLKSRIAPEVGHN